jgi:hypothetical protein
MVNEDVSICTQDERNGGEEMRTKDGEDRDVKERVVGEGWWIGPWR